MASTAFRIFVSSPGDVGFERRIALAVIERLRGEFGAHLDICPILWEHQPLRATEHFQEQIASTAEVDLVLFVLWTRLGTVLPEQFQRDDGTRYASGTEFEFEEAARAYHASGTPLMLAYIKKAERTVSLADRASALDAFAQKDALDGFVDQWFGNPQATFRRNRLGPEPDIAIGDRQPIKIIRQLQQDRIVDQHAIMVAQRHILALPNLTF